MHNHLAHRHLPPGPRTSSVAQLWHLATDTRDFYETYLREFGNVFTIRLFGNRPAVVFSSQDAISEILAAPNTTLGHNNDLVEAVIGGSLLLLDGDAHRSARRRLMPAFEKRALVSVVPLIDAAMNEGVDTWYNGQDVNTVLWSRKVTLHVILRSLLGVRDDDAYRVVFDDLIDFAEGAQRPGTLASGTLLPRFVANALTNARHGQPPLWLRPLNANKWMQSARRISNYLTDLVQRARSGQIDMVEGCILARILERVEAEGVEVSDRQLVDDLLALLMAGHDTTAISLCWLMQHLMQNPAVEERLREELVMHHKNGGDNETLLRLPYLDAVIKESMRISPITRDCQIFCV